jgi:hypothetical protein
MRSTTFSELSRTTLLLVGAYSFNIFQEARSTREGYISVNFLDGSTSGGEPSPMLADVVRGFRDALPTLCQKHGISASEFVALTARYSPTPIGCYYLVTVKDRTNRQSTTDYAAPDGRRVKIVDREGRARPKPVRRLQQ